MPWYALSIERPVHDHLLQRLGILCEPFETVTVAFEVPELAPNQASLFIRHLISPIYFASRRGFR